MTTKTEATTNELMDRLTVAASDAISDFADCRDRGYLKEHPDAVLVRLAVLTDMIGTVRAVAARELAAGKWGNLAADPEAHRTLIDAGIEYGNHTCNCDYCLHGSIVRDEPTSNREPCSDPACNQPHHIGLCSDDDCLGCRWADDGPETNPAPQAIVKLVSTRWGRGTTSCFACGRDFSYTIGEKIFHVVAPGLCDRPCGEDGGHRWDCAALGGDMCANCIDGLLISERDFRDMLSDRAEQRQRAAEIATKYANAAWVVTELMSTADQPF